MQPLIHRTLVLLLCVFVFSAHSQHHIDTFTKKEGLTSTIITTTLIDSKGIVWLGTDNGLNAFVNSQLHPIKSIEDNQTGKPLPMGRIENIYEDRQRNIWVSADNGLFLFNGEYWTSFVQKEADKAYIVKDFFEDRQGRIWCMQEYFQDFGEFKEFKFNMIGGKLQMYENSRWYNFDDVLAGSSSIDHKSVPKFFTGIFQDQAGNIWFGTMRGIYRFYMKEWTTYKKDELTTEKVFRLLNARNGEKWAATESGVSRFVDGEWINFTKKDGLSGNFVYDLKSDPTGRVWAFSRSEMKFVGLCVFEGGKWRAFDNNILKIKGFVEALIWDGDDVIAFSNDGVALYHDGMWKRFSKKEGLDKENFSLIQKDRYGKIWLAGGSGLYKYNKGKWDAVFSPEKKWTVSFLYVDKGKQLWVGTEKSGLFHIHEDTIVNYTESDGLVDDYIEKIFEDKKGNTWIITRKGISLFSPIPDQ